MNRGRSYCAKTDEQLSRALFFDAIGNVFAGYGEVAGHKDMTLPSSLNGLRRLLVSCFFVVGFLASAIAAAEQEKKSFAIPASTADKSLKQFSAQSGVEVIYPAAIVRGVRTPAVNGEMTAAEAVARLLTGTGLASAQDEKTGAFSISSRHDPNGSRAAPTTVSDRPSESRNSPIRPDRAGNKDDILLMSPFEVIGETRGYYATNVMSGTRLNSKLEDLGASISVVTKEQMQDFALLDLNDIFALESNTEGTAQFTDVAFTAGGNPIDNTQLNPTNANRIRGVGPANMTMGNFETSGRVPVDPINIDAVEISRGPNASMFGIGSAAGTVNSVPASANLARNSSQVALRADSSDGWRTSLDLNRVLQRDVLAVRGSMVRQYDGFHLKPSGFSTERYNGMMRFKPFSSTMLTASYSRYQAEGNRPNTGLPRDAITGWLAAGSPTWNNITGVVTAYGRPLGVFETSTPAAFVVLGADTQAYIDQKGLSYLGLDGPTTTTPAGVIARMRTAAPDPSGFLAAQPLLQDYPVLNNKAIYDWSKINLAAQNRFLDEAETIHVSLQQIFLKSERQTLALELGWFRELTERSTRNLFGVESSRVNFAPTISIDINERLADGSPNPFLLRPYEGISFPVTYRSPVNRDTYRAQLAYGLNLNRERNWLRWLGSHQVTAYGEYKDIQAQTIQFRDTILDAHPWIPAQATTTGRGSSSAITPLRIFHRYYVGDTQGSNVDYAPTAYGFGNYTLNWSRITSTASWVPVQNVAEPVQIGLAAANGNGGSANQWTIQKSQGGVIQSHWLRDRVVTTLGVRWDQRYSRAGGEVSIPDNINIDYDSLNRWAAGDWAMGKGRTTTAGVVVKPLPWFNLHANKSNSFNPVAAARGLYRNYLPDPSGAGEDYGIAVNLFSQKLVLRLNRYQTLQINTRNGAGATIAQRTNRIDYANTTGNEYNLERQATLWLTAAAAARGITLTQDQLDQQLADTMKVPLDWIKNNPAGSPAAVDDLTARGTEIELNYNPSSFWTMKLNATEQKSIPSGLSKEISDYVAERMPAWTSIIDPRVNRPWWTENYGGSNSQSFYLTNVYTPLKIAQALQGKSNTQVRRYRVNYATNFRLAGLTEHSLLKRFNVGGALRWEDKGSIGYRGVQQLPAIITDLDPNQPIWDKAHLYVDAFVGYRTRLFSDKVGLSLQLNVRNVTEGGRLQPILVEANGQASAFRIIDPRLFILSATFSL